MKNSLGHSINHITDTLKYKRCFKSFISKSFIKASVFMKDWNLCQKKGKNKKKEGEKRKWQMISFPCFILSLSFVSGTIVSVFHKSRCILRRLTHSDVYDWVCSKDCFAENFVCHFHQFCRSPYFLFNMTGRRSFVPFVSLFRSKMHSILNCHKKAGIRSSNQAAVTGSNKLFF